MQVTERSVLFITLDSCRLDTFLRATVPNMKAVAETHHAQAPSHFTYGSHAAMFVGFTPAVSGSRTPFLNPKFARLFRLSRTGWSGHARAGFNLAGRDIVDGFRNAGYKTVGTAAMGWFDPSSDVSQVLTRGFDHYHFAGHDGVARQLAWLEETLQGFGGDTFAFINVGETHVPYHFIGAPWAASDNPCVPFQTVDRADECRERQRLCCEYVDRVLAPLLQSFMHATILVCGDHGDCWGEDGVWEHGIPHPMTAAVPLLIRYCGTPVAA